MENDTPLPRALPPQVQTGKSLAPLGKKPNDKTLLPDKTPEPTTSLPELNKQAESTYQSTESLPLLGEEKEKPKDQPTYKLTGRKGPPVAHDDTPKNRGTTIKPPPEPPPIDWPVARPVPQSDDSLNPQPNREPGDTEEGNRTECSKAPSRPRPPFCT
jgi:hypothetical protein